MQTLVGGGGTTIRFSHAILQVYFTERLLTDDARRRSLARRLTGNSVVRTVATRCGWREHSITTTLIERTASNELLQALTIWCGKSGTGDRERVAKELRGRAGTCRDDAALRLVVTGMEILSSRGDPAVRKTFGAEAVCRAFEAAGRLAKLAAIDRLGELQLPCAYDLLVGLAQAPKQDHGVRLHAARTLAAGGEQAYRSVRNLLLGRDLAQIGAAAKQGAAWAIHDLTVLGWVLPGLSTGTRDGPFADETRAQVEALADLVRDKVRLDVEASIAQGFKLAALADPEGPVDDLVLDLLRGFKARFWFSRILLLQALCVRTAGQPRNHEVVDRFGRVEQSSRSIRSSARPPASAERPFASAAGSAMSGATRARPSPGRAAAWTRRPPSCSPTSHSC
jgi:hypothetical protein